jgi:uncharacterized membrane protein HdeD (DUF308 family)
MEKIMAETVPMPTCPMAETCKGLMGKPGSGFWMFIPGVIFIISGLTIIVFPQVLVWLVALALIVMGFAMLMMVNAMRNIGKRVQNRP